MFLVNSRLGRFPAAGEAPGDPSPLRHPFSRSYGAILPSSLTGVRSRACGFSPRPRVSVSGTGHLPLPRGFSWPLGEPVGGEPGSPFPPRPRARGEDLPSPFFVLHLGTRTTSTALGSSWGVPPSSAGRVGAGISTGCPSGGSLSGLPLGPPNLQRTNLPEEPLGFRRRGFSPLFSLLRPASSLGRSPGVLSDPPSATVPRSPTQKGFPFCHGFGGRHSPLPFSAPHRFDP